MLKKTTFLGKIYSKKKLNADFVKRSYTMSVRKLYYEMVWSVYPRKIVFSSCVPLNSINKTGHRVLADSGGS